MSDTVDEKPGMWIGGKYHAVADKNAPETRRPSEAQEMDRALDRLEDRRAGYEPSAPEDETPEPRRTFKNADEAAEQRQAEAGELREATKIVEQDNARRRDEQARGEIQQTTQWHSDDAAILGGLTSRARQFEADAGVFTRAYQQAQAMKSRGEAVPFEVQDKLAEEAQRLQAERAQLTAATSKVQHAAALKNAHASRLTFLRDFPELKNAETKKRFIEWAHKRGVGPAITENATDPIAIGHGFRQFQKEEAAARERHIDRPRKPLFTAGPLAPGGRVGDEMTVDQARDRLTRTGSMRDAENFLALSRERQKDREDV